MEQNQQQKVEGIVDTLMAEFIAAMAESQPMSELRKRLLGHIVQAQRDLDMLVPEGDYIYDGASY